MDSGSARRFGVPRESAMSKLDVPLTLINGIEERENREALGDGICSHIGEFTGTVREESDCLGVPTRDVVKVPVIVGAPHRLHIGCLFLCLCVLTDERRVPEHVGWASVNIAAE